MASRAALVVLVGALALGACTPLRWEHPRFGIAGADREFDNCARSARREAWRYSSLHGAWDFPRLRRDRRGRLYHDPFPRYRNPTFDEWNLRDYCMRVKGYRLVPVPQ